MQVRVLHCVKLLARAKLLLLLLAELALLVVQVLVLLLGELLVVRELRLALAELVRLHQVGLLLVGLIGQLLRLLLEGMHGEHGLSGAARHSQLCLFSFFFSLSFRPLAARGCCARSEAGKRVVLLLELELLLLLLLLLPTRHLHLLGSPLKLFSLALWPMSQFVARLARIALLDCRSKASAAALGPDEVSARTKLFAARFSMGGAREEREQESWRLLVGGAVNLDGRACARSRMPARVERRR